jgi:hypothetical protein
LVLFDKLRCLTYFITFTCYGARLHGDKLGSVDRRQNLVGSPLLEPNPHRVTLERWCLRVCESIAPIEAGTYWPRM